MIFRSEKPELIKTLTDKLRRFMPKAFFHAAKSQLKDHKKGQIAVGFQSKVVDGQLTSEGTIPVYIRDLYHTPNPLTRWNIDRSTIVLSMT